MAGEKAVWDFIFEMAQLKRTKRSGWAFPGVENPESIADHNTRAAQIGYILAKMENYSNPDEVCTILVFHEIAEARIGDINKVANGHVEYDEERVAKTQTEPLGEVGDAIFEKVLQILKKDTKSGIIAKDADYLETAATAKEYLERGYDTRSYIDNALARLKTRSANKLGAALMEQNSTGWWKEIKKF
ncbi:MAG: HD domain-containing protein [Candidatus Aenigmatarchaeota archaeon]